MQFRPGVHEPDQPWQRLPGSCAFVPTTKLSPMATRPDNQHFFWFNGR
jgi:hypothetical protein